MTDSEKKKEVEGLVADAIDDDIDGLIRMAVDFDNIREIYSGAHSVICEKIKSYLKRRFWTEYKNNDGTKVIFETIKEQKLDWEKISSMISSSQQAQVSRITTSEQLRIITKNGRERLNKYVRRRI